MNSFVLIKQVPDQSAKAGVNADGTIDRAKAKRMLNPFDCFALEAALQTKRLYGATVTAITMGPPPAIEILYEAIAHGVDRAVHLCDRRLAASDTLATAYALYNTVCYAGAFDLVFCGLQTTDGDTAQVGPQLAERLQVPQVTYCESFKVHEGKLIAHRVTESGTQVVRVHQLQRDEVERNQVIQTVSLDEIQADPVRCGLKGSPTIVAATEKVGEIGGKCVLFQGKPIDTMVSGLLADISLAELVQR
jgi:electron transfer flavoprotein beta subunit